MARFDLSILGRFTNRLGRRSRLVLRYVGIAFVALIVFVFALQLTFPYDRIKDKAVEFMATSNYEVTVGSVDRGWMPGRVYFNAVTLRTRPAKPGDAVTTFYIEKLEVDVGILALLGANASVDLDAKIGPGRIKGNVTLKKFGRAGFEIEMDGSDLPGASLPLASALGAPMTGKLAFSVGLDLPITKNKAGRNAMDWTKAEGHIDFSCPSGCTFGDGHTKLKPILKNRTNQVMVADGIDFGKVNIDSLVANVVITPAVGDADQHSGSYKPGRLEVTKLEVKSPDGELHFDYSMTLAPEFGDSVVGGCIRYKPNDSLLKKDETKKTYAAISTLGAELRSDGLFHIKLTDRFKDMKRLNQECGPNAKVNTGEDFGAHPPGMNRPNLTVQPDEGTRPNTFTPPPPPMPPPPPPMPTPADATTTPTTPGSAGPPMPREGEAAPTGAAAGSGEVGAPVR